MRTAFRALRLREHLDEVHGCKKSLLLLGKYMAL